MELPILPDLPSPPADKIQWPWIIQSQPVIDSQIVYPKISIVTPSYNQGDYLEETVRSVLLQQYPNLEYIIIDGGSTDNSVDIIKKYERWITYWTSEPDNGQSQAINKGFTRCTGDIITWLGSDDYLEENALYIVARKYSESQWAVLSGTCLMFYEGTNKSLILNSGNVTFNSLLEIWRMHFCPPQPAMFIRKNVLEKVGYLNESLRYAMDYELWLRISKAYPFKFINQNLAYYRVHESSKSGSTGGMDKFYPEWKKVRNHYLSEATFEQKAAHFISYYKHTLYRPIADFLNKRHRGIKKRLSNAIKHIR
jgi:glycosyltransferase involved in cell wall biosynthesis